MTAEGGDSEASAGRYLARQRQLREISLDELAARTKIPRRSLERLESGAFDGQADGFVRGFVRTVAEALGLDPNEAVMRLLREPPAAREPAPPLARVRLGWAIGGLLALAAVAAALLAGGRALRGRFAPEPPAVIYRTDAVRSLVEERARGGGAAAPGSAAPAPAQGGAALPRPEEGPGGL